MRSKQNTAQNIFRLGKIILFSFTFLILNFSAASQDVDTQFNAFPAIGISSVNGGLTLQADGKIIIYGGFPLVQGIVRNGIARLNADGSLDNSFNCASCDFQIRSVAVQPDGKILVGGSKDGQFLAARLRRLNQDGSLDTSFTSPFDEQPSPGVYRSVQLRAVQPDGKIFASLFISGPGNNSHILYRLDSTGAFDNSFANLTFNSNTRHFLNDLKLLADGKLLIGGAHDFGYLFRVNTDGTNDMSFQSPVLTHGTPQTAPEVLSFDTQTDGKIVFIGTFHTVNGTMRNGFARLNNDQTVDLQYNPPLQFSSSGSITVRKVLLQTDGKLLVSSLFANGKNLLRLNTDGSFDSGFDSPSTIDSLSGWTLDANQKIVILANFTAEGSKYARINTDGTLETVFNLNFAAFCQIYSTTVQPDGKILIGGNFTQVNGISRHNIARINPDGSLDTSFESVGDFSPLDSFVLQPDGKILIVRTVSNIIRLNSNGSLDAGFNVNAQASVRSAAVQADGKILIGGFFTSVNGTPRTGLARLNPDGSLETGFNPILGVPAAGNPRAMKVLIQEDGKIVIGGAFSSVNGINRANFARLNADGSTDTAFDAGSIDSPRDLVRQPDGKYLVVMLNSIFRRNANGSPDASFQLINVNTTINKVVSQTDGSIIVGGSFTTVNNLARSYLARFKANGSQDMAFLPNAPNASVNTLALQADNKIIVGGTFTSIGGLAKPSLARLYAKSKAAYDFDGDGKTDISIFRPSAGEWWFFRSSDGGNYAAQFGASSDKIVPADYTGDGKSDFAFFRPSSGQWFVLRSEDFSFFAFPFGTSGDTPVPADYDGDGRADAAVFRESDLTWYIQKSSGGTDIINFGAAGDKPVVADYDGDGKADIAVFRPNGISGAEWWIRRSSNQSVIAFQFGTATDKPVQADFTGDGKTDAAIWRPANGNWFILRSEDFSFYAFPFGVTGDIPVVGDYDGDGISDAGVFRPSDLNWYIQRSTAGTLIQHFGIAGDLPVPNAFVP